MGLLTPHMILDRPDGFSFSSCGSKTGLRSGRQRSIAGHPHRMRQLQTLAFTLFTLPFALGAQTNSQASSPLVLPSVTAYALDRVKVTLPADFAAPLNLLILSFQRYQQPAVDGWVPVVTQINGTNIRVQPWLLPVGPRENILYRWWLNASLRGSLAASLPRH